MPELIRGPAAMRMMAASASGSTMMPAGDREIHVWPVHSEQIVNPFGTQCPEGMDKADTGVELGIAGQALFHPKHVDQRHRSLSFFESFENYLAQDFEN